MRLWSIAPKYLDTKGLVAVWREGLLAKHVLEGKTKGYKNHPQLNRFKQSKNPLALINLYLIAVCQEATQRTYHFDASKLNWDFPLFQITVTQGQIDYEYQHLLKKLEHRDHKKYLHIKNTPNILPHPIFKVIKGAIEDWEVF